MLFGPGAGLRARVRHGARARMTARARPWRDPMTQSHNGRAKGAAVAAVRIWGGALPHAAVPRSIKSLSR